MSYSRVRVGDICAVNKSSYSQKEKWKYVNYLDTGNITNNRIDEIQYIDLITEKLPSRAKRKVNHNSIIISTVRPNQLHYGIIKSQPENFLVSTGFAVIDVMDDTLDADYLYYVLTQKEIVAHLHAIAEQSTSAYPAIKPSDIQDLEILIPDLKTQKKIASLLISIDYRISINTKINEKLEQQAQALFVELFSEHIDCIDKSIRLGELVTTIDNRGKTPPLEPQQTRYPIIDVKALSGCSRIINYNNCTKYVSEETYNNWFRSGHPQQFDILLSTVGSLAEMKLFLGDIGCIAQNVVGFRCKEISPLYLYQYLSYIKNDLVAYNIGSVQPSIKVTHIIKHLIYVPEQEELELFDRILKPITLKIYNNCLENERLAALRDTLLPKLMSGEIDVSQVKI